MCLSVPTPRPQKKPSTSRVTTRFSFIVSPLSLKDILMRHGYIWLAINFVRKRSPPPYMLTFEKSNCAECLIKGRNGSRECGISAKSGARRESCFLLHRCVSDRTLYTTTKPNIGLKATKRILPNTQRYFEFALCIRFC